MYYLSCVRVAQGVRRFPVHSRRRCGTLGPLLAPFYRGLPFANTGTSKTQADGVSLAESPRMTFCCVGTPYYGRGCSLVDLSLRPLKSAPAPATVKILSRFLFLFPISCLSSLSCVSFLPFSPLFGVFTFGLCFACQLSDRGQGKLA